MTTLANKARNGAAPGNEGAAPSRSPKISKFSPMELRRRRLFWPFLLPALIIYTVIMVGPTIASFVISFNKYDGIGEMEFKGVANYVRLFKDAVFLTSLKNTLIILVAVGIVVFVLAFTLTMLLRDMRGRKFARSVMFFPNIVSALALAVLWGFIFQYEGVLDTLLGFIGMGPTNILQDNLFLVICLGLVWTNTGFYVTIIMAGVDQIPPYLYEEAELAGCSAFQKFRHITLPLTWDVVATAAVLWTISSLKVFDFIFAFGGSAVDLPPTKVWNTAVFVYARTFGGNPPKYEFGYASASAVVTLIAIMLLVVLMRRLFKRDAIQL